MTNSRIAVFVVLSILTCAMARQITLSAANVVGSAGREIPSLHLESATMIGEGGNLRIQNVSVSGPADKEIRHYNISCKLGMAVDGSVRLENITSVLSKYEPNNVNSFIPGSYTDAAGTKYLVKGPGLVEGGRIVWSIRREDAAGGSSFDATWTTGPVASHPQFANMNYVASLPTGYTYGIADTNYLGWGGGGEKTVIGVRQISESIAVSAFRLDRPEEKDQSPAFSQSRVIVLTPVVKK